MYPQPTESTAAEIVDCIGLEAAETLVKNFAGRDLYIAAQYKDKSELSQLLGKEAVKNLAQYFAGTRLYIPKNITSIDIDDRNSQIYQLREGGSKVGDLSWKFDLTERQICRILQKMRLKLETQAALQC